MLTFLMLRELPVKKQQKTKKPGDKKPGSLMHHFLVNRVNNEYQNKVDKTLKF